MFVYLFSLLSIFIENSLPVTRELYFFSIPFFTYVVIQKKIIELPTLFLIVFMTSLQTNSLFTKMVFFAFFYFVLKIYFFYMEYKRGTIIYISLLQLLFYLALSFEIFKMSYLIFHFIAFLILNYFYSKNFN